MLVMRTANHAGGHFSSLLVCLLIQLDLMAGDEYDGGGVVFSNAPQMSDALELSSWATCRLVAGQPSLLNTNYDTLRNR
jgi:hypothetical protein